MRLAKGVGMADRRAAWRQAGPGVVGVLALAVGLGGCTGSPGAMSDAFVDPSAYDLYDCNQLAAERVSLAGQLAANQKLIDKARTGVAGDAVAELAYGNANLSLRGQMRLIDRVWEKNRCEGTVVPPAVPHSSARQR